MATHFILFFWKSLLILLQCPLTQILGQPPHSPTGNAGPSFYSGPRVALCRGFICNPPHSCLGWCNGSFHMSAWPASGMPRELIRHHSWGVSLVIFPEEISIWVGQQADGPSKVGWTSSHPPRACTEPQGGSSTDLLCWPGTSSFCTWTWILLVLRPLYPTEFYPQLPSLSDRRWTFLASIITWAYSCNKSHHTAIWHVLYSILFLVKSTSIRCLECISNEILLYSPGNSIHSLWIDHDGR